MNISQLLDLLFVLYLSKRADAKMEGFVVHGNKANISDFPFVAYLGVSCDGTSRGWRCGSSILNQHILLTAAHCLDGCDRHLMVVNARVGTEIRGKGTQSSIWRYIKHCSWSPNKGSYDLALTLLKTPLTLGSKVSRVILMRKPPKSSKAKVAGWGLVDESTLKLEDMLRFTKQTIVNRENCLKTIKIPQGVICAGISSDDGYASWGDSGSPLTVLNYYQIGLVSYKVPEKSKRLVIYTDIAYYYDWIVQNFKELHCG